MSRRNFSDNSVEPDYRNIQLRQVWEKVCKPMGYPDPRRENRTYISTVIKTIKSRHSLPDLEEKAQEMKLGKVTIRNKKNAPRKISVLPYFKVMFTDLTEPDPQEHHIQLQYGIRKRNDGDISHQDVGEPVLMFHDGHEFFASSDANLSMYLDLCGQCQDSPAYLAPEQQQALGFRLELLNPPKGMSRLFKTYGFSKTTEAPVTVRHDNTKLIEAHITTSSYTRLYELCRGMEINVVGMKEAEMKAASYQKAASPSNHSKLMQLISTSRAEMGADVDAAVGSGLLVFSADRQWYIKQNSEQVEKPALLRGTLMADCVTHEGKLDIDMAKARLVSMMIGSESEPPRTDITREVKNALKKDFIRIEVIGKIAKATDSEDSTFMLETIADAISDGIIYLDSSNKAKPAYKWRDTGKTIITTDGTVSEKPLRQFLVYVETKGIEWFRKACEDHALEKEPVK